MQTIGIGGFAIAGCLMIWGLRLFRRQNIRPLWLRGVTALTAAIALSLAASQIPTQGWTLHPYLGGSGGTMMLGALRDFAAHLSWPVAAPWFTVSAGFFALLSFGIGAALQREEMLLAAGFVQNLALQAWSFAAALAMRLYDWVQHYNDPSYLGRSQARRKPAAKLRRAPSLSVPEEEDDEAENEDEYYDSEDAAEEDDEEQEEEEESDSGDEAPRRLLPGFGSKKKGPAIPVVAAAKKPAKKNTDQKRFPLSEGDWDLPDLSLLQEMPKRDDIPHLNEDALRRNAELLQNVLADFNIEGDIVSIHPGPVVTLYELEPAPGTKTSRVISLADDIARSMSAVSVRCAVVPGRNVIGIELPNKERQIVYMQELITANVYEKTQAKLPLALGKDIGGQPIVADLAKMPHLLVAGTTGSGKSVAINTMILSLLFALPPEKCRFIMIDPKMLELSVYDDIPHLLAPVVTEPGKAVVALKWTVREMEDRYRAMSKLGVRNIEGYNQRLREAVKKGETLMKKVQTGFDPESGEATYEEQPMDMTELPYIVVVVDEFADLMLVAGKDVENAIQRLAQMARAAGIHLIMATQRPSVDVITGVIKANFPTRISFQVTSKIDSRTILGESGAEQLLGMGDMLYMAPGGRITRVHGPFVSDKDVEQVTDFLRAQGEPAYIEEVTEDSDFGDSEIMNAMFGGGEGGEKVDELYDQAVAIVAREGKASTSFVQRHLQIGYNRAARIIEEMERQGVISKANAMGKREVLVQDFSEA